MSNSGLSESVISNEKTEDITGCVGGVSGPQECCEINVVLGMSHYPDALGQTNTRSFTGVVTLGVDGMSRRLTHSFSVADGRKMEEEENSEKQEFNTEVVLMG